MGVPKNHLRAVGLEGGHTSLIHHLFGGAKKVLPDFDESVGDESSCGQPFCDCSPSAEDVASAIEEGDEDFLCAHGLLHLLYDEDATRSRTPCYEGGVSNVVFFPHGGAASFVAECVHEEAEKDEEVQYSHIRIGGAAEYPFPKYHNVSASLRKWSLLESHGVHGRKPRRTQRVTIRGAKVRAEIVYGPRGPRCIGLVAQPRLLK